MRNLDQLIEHQVRRWQADRAREPASDGALPQPSVTISRQFGSQGGEVGRRAAGLLGFTFWDQELVHRMADAAEAQAAALSWVDERPRGAWADFVDGILMGDEYTESEYLRRLIQVVRGIANRGAGVILGRGSHYILGPERALRVRVVAPLEARVASVAERHGVSPAEARRLVQRTDRERESFMRHHYDRKLEDAASFDLVVNAGSMSLDQTAAVIASTWRARFGG